MQRIADSVVHMCKDVCCDFWLYRSADFQFLYDLRHWGVHPLYAVHHWAFGLGVQSRQVRHLCAVFGACCRLYRFYRQVHHSVVFGEVIGEKRSLKGMTGMGSVPKLLRYKKARAACHGLFCFSVSMECVLSRVVPEPLTTSIDWPKFGSGQFCQFFG